MEIRENPTDIRTAADYDFAGSFEYKKSKGSQYIYNSNGSLVADKSRGIAYITYDYNNNPQTIYFTNGYMTKYTYSALGDKLSVEHFIAQPNVAWAFGVQPDVSQSQPIFAGHTDYLVGGSLIVKENIIKRLFFDGGYVDATALSSPTTYGFTPYYYNKDHLGNNREVVNRSNNVQQLTNYYPFGTPYADPSAVIGSSVQPYKYNGKELDVMHGLNTYDYGARQYYPVVGRWDRMDPLCEKYYDVSPYVYCGNNPVNAIDKDGLFPNFLISYHKAPFYRANYYTLNAPASHLLSLVSGISETYIRNIEILERGFGHFYPLYSSNKGGGAITLGNSPNNVSISFTPNFFEDDSNEYDGHGYGQNFYSWVFLLSYEVGHIKHIEKSKNELFYISGFLRDYFKYGHDNTPREMEADKGSKVFKEFYNFTINTNGYNAFEELFNSNKTENLKIQIIDKW